MPVAQRLRALLEAEAASIHPHLLATAIPAMGGGMGVVATAPIPPGATLACLPFRSMVTVKKARLNLALAEVALSSSQGSSAGAAFRDGVVRFVAELPPGYSDCDAALGTEVFAPGAEAAAAAVSATVARLRQKLSDTDTIVCYLILMASLYGRWGADARGEGECSPVLRFSHENEWMGPWMLALPSAYDNLLELGVPDENTAPGDAAASSTAVADAAVVGRALWFSRHRAKVAQEQAEARQRYTHCVGTLQCLQRLPQGICVASGDGAAVGGGGAGTGASATAGHSSSSSSDSTRATRCPFHRYLWAFNSLMSRGFAFDEDVWAMMPFVDYFNYALDANGTMFTRPAAATEGGRRRNVLSAAAGCLTRRAVGRGRAPPSYEYAFMTTRPIAAGEQVFLHYGAYTDFELLMWYGFTLTPFLHPAAPAPAPAPAATAGASGHAASEVFAQLLDPVLRRQLFRCRLDAGAAAAGDEEAEERLVEEEERWATALQRSYAHVFTPLANTDGIYAAPVEGRSWLGAVVARFLDGQAVPPALTPAEAAVHHWALRFAEKWRGGSDAMEKMVALRGFAAADGGPVALGVMGPSAQMQGLVRLLAAQGTFAEYQRAATPSLAVGAVTAGEEERAAVVRALAWMELCDATQHQQPVALADGGVGVKGGGAAVAVAAEDMSRSVVALLRFLAVDATGEQLRAYLSRDPDF